MTTLTRNENTVVPLPGGKVLNVTGLPQSDGVAYRLNQALGGTNSLQSWAISGGSAVTVGPYADDENILVACEVGGIEIAVEAFTGGGGGSGAVASVNMKTGNVQLTAEDVGAVPAGPVFGAVQFNNATELTRGPMTGVVDSATGIKSVWIFPTANGIFMDNTNQDMEFKLETGDQSVTISLYSLDQANSLTFKVIGGFPLGRWAHLLMAWDMGHLPQDRVFHLAINGVLSGAIQTVTGTTAFDVDYSNFDVAIGSGSGYGYVSGGMAEDYFAPGQYLDLTVPANIAKFIDAHGKPVDLGVNGELPTGTAPAVFFHAEAGDEAATYPVNRGTGGAFALTGTLVASATSPSDTQDIGFANPMTTAGDLIVGGTAGAASRLANPGAGTFNLQSINGVLTWVAP